MGPGGTRSRAVLPRPLWARLVVAAGAVILTVLMAEGIARVAFPGWAPRTARLTDFWRYDPRYGWSHIPGVRGTFRSHGVDAQVVINAKGFRGPEVPYSRTPDRRRVLFLGDSFTWGFGVSFEDMFTTRLERRVPRLEAVNLGVSGYSTDQELLLYQDEGRKYRPDLVVVVVAYNDSLGNARTIEYAVYGKPAFVMDEGRLRLINQPVEQPDLITRAFTRLAWRSYILTQTHRALYEAGIGRGKVHAGTPATQSGSAVAAANIDGSAAVPPRLGDWTLTQRLLLTLAQAVRADGAELLVVFADGIPAAPALTRALAADRVRGIVLDEVLDSRDPSLHLADELHWNPAGHVRVADALAEPIREMLARPRR
jgi:lysophospholipase L1-like esterase